MSPQTALTLADLPLGGRAVVVGVQAAGVQADGTLLRRLQEIGFVPGEPVQLLRRGPGGREPLAVQVGDTQFGLRLLEAQCVRVQPLEGPDGHV